MLEQVGTPKMPSAGKPMSQGKPMSNRRDIIVILLLVISLVAARPTQGAMAVFDAANYGQSVRSAITEIGQLQEMVKQSLPLAQMQEVLGMAGELQRLLGLLQAISLNIAQRTGWWRGVQSPTTAEQLWHFTNEARSMCFLASHDALSAQQLLMQVTDLLGTVGRLLDRASTITGSASGLQAAQGSLAQVSATVASLTGIQAGFNEAQICEQLTRAHAASAMQHIESQWFRGLTSR
jgi:hypothetical protein